MNLRLARMLTLFVCAPACRAEPLNKETAEQGLTEGVDGDGDGASSDVDCNDTDPSVGPDATEVCDGIDNNCDGQVDEGSAADTSAFFADADGDGYGDSAQQVLACTAPEGFVDNDLDCDDTNAATFPSADEWCDGIDNDCDSAIDEDGALDPTTSYPDVDGDGFGDSASSVVSCSIPEGFVDNADDCDDEDNDVFPGAEERCDNIDNDCDNIIDEDDAIDSATWFADLDADGFGDPSAAVLACEAPPAYVDRAFDCDDTDPGIHPDAAEVCDSVDNDCDGTIDEDDAIDAATFYADTDADAFGNPAVSTRACAAPTGFVADNTDCDDTRARVSPAGTEVCDAIDNDCDGTIDEDDAADAATWYADTDLDTFGDRTTGTRACIAPAGFVADATDCDDSAAAVFPGATEWCDAIDNDCDGTTDEDDAADALAHYADIDGDGFGDAATRSTACEVPSTRIEDATDCDDTAAAVFPGADEWCDGIDNDCDGTTDEDDALDADVVFADLDLDGYGDPAAASTSCTVSAGFSTDDTDCDDSTAAVNPGATEQCSGIDEDCDGKIDDLGPTVLRGGSLVAGASRHYQYADVTPGNGALYANWTLDPRADSFELAVGSTPGDDDIAGWTDVGAVSSATLSGLSLDGAWDGAEYYVTIRATTAGQACAASATSDTIQIAEAATWTGNVADLRPPDAIGGYTTDWPVAGVDAIYGEHWFEDIDIAAGTTVYVQGWGAEDSVTAGISSSNPAVTAPQDGWVSLFANSITIAGTVTASGRGYGGGGGGGAGIAGGYQGNGGTIGLGGDGGVASTSYAGAGGGGSPSGAGGVGATRGGAGAMGGGGSGSTGCAGQNGNAGGTGSVGTIGGTGGTASSGRPGTGGAGEFSAGGGNGVSGCDNWSGGGGGGYGGGGGGGSQWAGSTAEASGGGGGGAGGSGGARSVHGAAAAGPFGGSGGVNGGGYTGVAGARGGYRASGGNGDTTTDLSWVLGSGGGGGSGGYQETGGGGGGAGGGAIVLYAVEDLILESTAAVLANGAGGGGGARDDGGSSTSAAGGGGAGGTLVLSADNLTILTGAPYLSALGGNGQTANGGTIKLFYGALSGNAPSSGAAGRVYDAGSGSHAEP